MRPGRLVMAMIGGLLTLVGFAATTGGGALVVLHATQRDSAGFYQLPAQSMQTPTAALVSPLELPPGPTTNYPLGTVKVTARSTGTAPVFVGIAATGDVQRWLSGTAYARVQDWGYGPAQFRAAPVNGTPDASPPAGQSFWTASASGSSQATLTWPAREGDWSLVVMNADGRGGVAVNVTAGSNTGLLLPVGIAGVATGAVLLAVGIVLAVLAVRGLDLAGPEPSVPGSYPVRVRGRLEPGLSRWLWLVKWFLAIPHYLVLALLWTAALVLTGVAWFAILFTGRYPRSIFEFNVGVLRWSWRVSYYAFGALGTDRYPPFSLAPDPTYPADLAVDYPERLSRGLVLVKSWLLAIPQLLIVGLFAGGWTFGRDQWWFGVSGGGVIGILVLVAAIVLLVTGAYPGALFDVVMGLNRWCYRVYAYVGLMRDEYPPFRFDAGGPDPGTVPAVPPSPEPPGPQAPPADPGPLGQTFTLVNASSREGS